MTTLPLQLGLSLSKAGYSQIQRFNSTWQELDEPFNTGADLMGLR